MAGGVVPLQAHLCEFSANSAEVKYRMRSGPLRRAPLLTFCCLKACTKTCILKVFAPCTNSMKLLRLAVIASARMSLRRSALIGRAKCAARQHPAPRCWQSTRPVKAQNAWSYPSRLREYNFLTLAAAHVQGSWRSRRRHSHARGHGEFSERGTYAFGPGAMQGLPRSCPVCVQAHECLRLSYECYHLRPQRRVE